MKMKNATINKQQHSLKRDISNIIQFSTALMGVAAFVVLCCHSKAYVSFSSPYRNLIEVALGFLAQYGVRVFFFLSAIRLFFSMKKDDKPSNFYKKRLVRILVPYVMISLVCQSLKYLVIAHDLWGFIASFFLFGYYIDGGSTWFIAAILPMYFVYPLLYRARIKYRWFTPVAIVVYFMLLLLIGGMFPSYYNVIANMTEGGFSFLLGVILAPYIYEKKKINILLLFGMCSAYLLLFIILMFYPTFIGGVLLAFFSAGIPALLCYAGACFLNKAPQIFNKALEFCGKMSLELYLLGIVSYLMSSFGLSHLISPIDPNGFLFYFVTMVTIFILSIVFFYVDNHIVSFMVKKKAPHKLNISRNE